jgi:hypothetical protein
MSDTPMTPDLPPVVEVPDLPVGRTTPARPDRDGRPQPAGDRQSAPDRPRPDGGT